jgi:SNF2 family DNA or RNA helicase
MSSTIDISLHGDPPGTWRIASSYFSTALRDCAKAAPGMHWDDPTKSWVGYPDAVELTCRFLKERGVGYRGLRDMKAAALSTSHLLPVAYKKLRDYQKVGVDFLVARGESGALLADDLGLGKSCQSIRAARAFRKKTVIVCLSQAIGVWAGNDYMESQVEKWWPLVKREGSMIRLEGTSLPTHEWRVWKDEKKLQTRTVERLQSTIMDGVRDIQRDCGDTPSPKDLAQLVCGIEWRCSNCNAQEPYTPLRDAPDVAGCEAGLPKPSTRIVVVHYDILHAWVDYLLDVWGAGTAIFDELHEVVGDKAIRTRAVTKLAWGCDVRIGLTGTPMANRPKSLYRTVDILSPGRFGNSPFTYLVRHCAGFQQQVTLQKVVWNFSGSSHEKELNRRLRYFMLRRTKAEVQQNLPPMIREIIDIKIPAKACLNVDLSVLKRSSVARQALALSADAKLPTVIEAIKAHVRAGSKVIAFSHRKLVAEHIADAIRAAGMPACVVNGDVPKKKRDERIADCKNAEGGYVLACTLDTCSTGIDLSFANVAVYSELTYEPFVLVQSGGRLHRHGQTRTVLCQFFIGRGSIDDLIAQEVISKLDTFGAVIGDTGDSLASDLDSMPKGRAALDLLYETLKTQGAGP